MNILNKISIKNLKLNKKRTVSTIIGIILSCALICAVGTMVKSFQATLIENAINTTGYYHLKISDLTNDDIKSLKNNRNIKDILSIYENGYGKLENCQNEYKPYLKLYSMDKTSFEFLKFKLVEGNFPTNSNEIIISKHIIENGGVDYKIGDKIKVSIGKRMTLDNYELYYSNPYNEELEQLVDTTDYEFTIVGMIERPNYNFENYSDPGYTIISTNINSEKNQVYMSLKNPREYKTAIASVLGASSYDKISRNKENLKYEDFRINNELLRWEAFAFSDNTILMLYGVAGVVIFIIIFTSAFCIRNSFAIATTEKMKMYGMLASIGATRKQIKRNVITEALMLGIIGIPIGILSGIFAVFVLIKIVNSILGDFLFGREIVMNISFLPILLSVILGIVTIYLSSISSARRASKVSPMDLLRNSQKIEIKSKKLKTPKIIKKWFKMGGVLAYKNLKRSKKKYRTTVISLAVSICVFISMNSFIVNMFGFTSNYYEDYDYNMMVYARGNEEDDINRIIKLNNIDEYFILYEAEDYIKVTDLSKIEKVDEIELQEDGEYDEETGVFTPSGLGKYSALQICALDNETFKKYTKKIGVNYEKVKTTGILCDNYLYYDDSGKQIETRRYNYGVGDIITGKLNNIEESFKVGAITDIRPYGLEKRYYGGGYLVINRDEYKNINLEPMYILIQSRDTNGFIKELKDADIDVGYVDYEESAKQEKSMTLVIKIFLYGFITVITLIGVTNIFNTITSNMELRQKEFAMLKSIGMTKREFSRMINLETIFYSTKALIYGIILGLIGTFSIYKAFEVKINTEMYIPITPIIISIIAVFVLVFVIMKYSINKINKQNTIETIRNENI